MSTGHSIPSKVTVLEGVKPLPVIVSKLPPPVPLDVGENWVAVIWNVSEGFGAVILA